MHKRGQANIIVVVLIILIVLSAVIIVWNVVNIFLQNSTDEISSNSFTNKFDIMRVDLPITGGAKVIVRPTKGEVSGLNFIFYDKDGENIVIEEKDNLPGQLESKSFEFNASQIPIAIDRVSVVPVYRGRNAAEVNEPKVTNRWYVGSLDNTLIAWWKLDGNAEDSTRDHDGIVEGVEFSQDSERGAVGGWKGVLPNRIRVPDHPDLDLVSDFSISIWYKYSDGHVHDFWRSLLQKGGDCAKGERTYAIVSRFKKAGFTTGNCAMINPPALDNNEWRHIIMVRSGNLNKVYFDGNFHGQVNRPDAYVNNLDLILGGGFEGWMDDIMIFDRVLSDEEVSVLHEYQK